MRRRRYHGRYHEPSVLVHGGWPQLPPQPKHLARQYPPSSVLASASRRACS